MLELFYWGLLAGAIAVVLVCKIAIQRFSTSNRYSELNETDLFKNLRSACVKDKVEIVRQILQLRKITDLDRNIAGSNLLCLVSRGSSVEIARLLIKYGASRSSRTRKGDTPLICAARNGHVELVEYLLNLGVDVNERGHREWSALHWASLNGRTEIASLLLAYGADLDATTVDGQNCVFLGCLSGHVQLVTDMISYGASVFNVDVRGDTPLHVAARQASSAVPVLIRANAVYQRNNAGETPLDAALLRSNQYSTNYMLVGRPELRQNFHRDAIELAIAHCHNTSNLKNILKVLEHLCKAELDHFEIIVSQIVSKLLEITPILLKPASNSDTTFPMTRHLRSDRESAGLPVEDFAVGSAPTTSSQYEVKQSSPPQPPPSPPSPISVFHHLANALTTITLEVMATPKMRGLVGDAVLRQRWLSLFAPLEQIWAQMDQCMQEAMEGLDERSDESCESARDRLTPIPTMMASCYSICEVLMPKDNIPSQKSEDETSKTKFLLFADRNHAALRFLLKHNIDLLTEKLHFLLDLPPTLALGETGPVIQTHSYVDFIEKLSFEQKRNLLRFKLVSEMLLPGPRIELSRWSKKFLLNCNHHILNEPPQNLRRDVFVKFSGEVATGAGVRREWFQYVAQQLVSEENGLFELCADRTSFTPVADAKETPKWTPKQREQLFQFAGRFLGMAVVHQGNIDLSLSLPTHKFLLGREYTLKDMKHVDETVHQSLNWILENQIDNEDLGLTFEVTARGTNKAIPLGSHPSAVEVTDANKNAYVRELLSFYFEKECANAWAAMRTGFYEILPRICIAPMMEDELAQLISGQRRIDLNDWKANTKYLEVSDQNQIDWFWQWMEQETPEMHKKVLQFVTGSSTVPLGGFAKLRGPSGYSMFTISLGTKRCHFPTATTCFNILKLPQFESPEELKAKMLMAVSHGCLGFSSN